MIRIIGRRLAMAVPLLVVVSFLTFGLESLVPGDPAATILGQNATPASIAAMDKQLGLDKPLLTSYWDWLDHLVHGSLGSSVINGQSVAGTLNSRLSVTLSIVVLSIIVSAVVGVALGMISATRGGVTARIVDMASLTGLALPSFWVAIILVAIFAVKLGIFPAVGYVPWSQSPGGWIDHIVLPVVALSLLGITSVAKQARDSTLDALEADYIVMLRGNGLSTRRILLRHVLRNAAVPVVTVLGVAGVGMLGGAVFVENVFVLPGLGSLATQTTLDHDLPVILGIALYFTVIVIVMNLLTDIVYALLNPKVRVS